MLVLKSLALPNLFKKTGKVARKQTNEETEVQNVRKNRDGFFVQYERMLGSVADLIIEPYDK